MNDDIVTRLREQYFTCECFGYGDCSRCESDKKAADEIERLRAEVRALETERDQWQRMATRD
jgi:hypothetical protein